MKKLIPFLASTFFVAQAFSQAALSPPAPALSAGSVAPAISPASASPSFNPVSSPNLTGTNVVISVNELAPLLTNLEMNIVQVLPLLSDFNDEFDFVNINQSGQQVSGTGTPSSTLFSMSPALSTGTAVVHVSGTVSASNSFLLPPGLAGLGTTNGLKTITMTRDTLRALLVLQADMERMLPVLDAVNGGTNFITVGVTDTGVTNTLR